MEPHPEKSGILVLGSKKFQAKIKDKIKREPISLHKFVLKMKLDDKYLGQIFDSSLATSAFSTVKDRAGKIKGASLEIKQIIEEKFPIPAPSLQ